jgi:protein ImuA
VLALRPIFADAAVWRATELGTPVADVQPSGWPQVDAELPGGGWPGRSLTDVLQPQPSTRDWRLLAPALRAVVAAGQTVVVVGPPKLPTCPGFAMTGWTTASSCGSAPRHPRSACGSPSS